MHVKVAQIGGRLSDELSKLQQPIEGMSCEQWKICARLRHIFHNLELYVRMKEEMVTEYRDFKTNKSKNNFRMLQAVEKIQEKLLNESLPIDINIS